MLMTMQYHMLVFEVMKTVTVMCLLNLIFSLSSLLEEISGAWMSSISFCTKKTRSRLLTSTISYALRD